MKLSFSIGKKSTTI